MKLDIVGLQDLSYDLLTIYPGLARDHFGVEVHTGQILPPDIFVAAYGANALAAPLDTAFRFRDDEVNEVLDALVLLAMSVKTSSQRASWRASR